MFNAFMRSLSYNPSTRWLFKKVRISSKKYTVHRSKTLNTAEPRKTPSGSTRREEVIQGVLNFSNNTLCSVGGRDIVRNSGTWVIGDIGEGVPVVINAAQLSDGRLYAKKITCKDSKAMSYRKKLDCETNYLSNS